MAIDLIKRSELSRGLTNSEQDSNMTALETFINGLLAGTAGYEAGNALKVGGILAAALLTDSNCPYSIAGAGWPGYQKLKSGLIIQWGSIYFTSGQVQTWTFPIAFPVACAFANCVPFWSGTDCHVVQNTDLASASVQFKLFPSSASIAGYCFAVGY